MPKSWLASLLFFCVLADSQSPGGGGTLKGAVRDPADAVLPSAAVVVSNHVTGFTLRTRTDSSGAFVLTGIPLNRYSVAISASGFQASRIDLSIASSVPVELSVRLVLAKQQTSVTVDDTAGALVGYRPVSSDTVARHLLEALPTFSPDAGLNDAIILTTPGVAADSNGFFHPLGDHAQVSYVIDGQPVTDQRNKVFSTSVPANAIQSMEVIAGLPAAEYGDKTSLVINAATRSGLGQKPSGSLLLGYGSFGSLNEETTLGLGGARWGNFLAVNVERTGRFLDTPEFWPMHDKGNTSSVFDRIDQQRGKDAAHLNLMLARNWFQVPTTYDQPLQDQRQKVVSFNIAPGYQRTLSSRTLFTVNSFLRGDQVDYYPSRNPLNDSPATLSQDRSLLNFGVRVDVSQVKGRHNWKAGGSITQTRLNEEFRLGITDPNYNAPSSPGYLPSLLPYDLSRGGRLYEFRGAARINQQALFAQDSITLGKLAISLGVRFERYDGLTRGRAVQPRTAFSYLLKRTGTAIRGGYSHTLETPTNENLVVSSSTGAGGLASNLFQGQAQQRPLALGSRNQYDAGFQQSAGKWLVLDVSYFRKYTRNAFDFDALFSTPVTFPIGWKQSKLDGVSARITTTELRGFRAYATMGHANARFFGPENGGVIFNSSLSIGAYRQDHDQVYQQNVNLHYGKGRWWADFTWRYDSGLVVGAVNNLADALALTADQQTVIGLYCGASRASLTNRISSCASSSYGADRIHILAPGAENDDHNPPRATARNIFNLGVGSDNLFHTEKVRTMVRFTVLNLSNYAALYNFLSPFSGTHWVEPRSYQMQFGWAF